MYAATNLPIIPLALNSGQFWQRNSFIKRSGKVVFEFLPPIDSGLPERELMEQLQSKVEERSNALMLETNVK